MLKDIDFFIFWRLKENIPPIDLHLILGDPDFWNIEFDELSISNLIFYCLRSLQKSSAN